MLNPFYDSIIIGVFRLESDSVTREHSSRMCADHWNSLHFQSGEGRRVWYPILDPAPEYLTPWYPNPGIPCPWIPHPSPRRDMGPEVPYLTLERTCVPGYAVPLRTDWQTPVKTLPFQNFIFVDDSIYLLIWQINRMSFRTNNLILTIANSLQWKPFASKKNCIPLPSQCVWTNLHGDNKQ